MVEFQINNWRGVRLVVIKMPDKELQIGGTGYMNLSTETRSLQEIREWNMKSTWAINKPHILVYDYHNDPSI